MVSIASDEVRTMLVDTAWGWLIVSATPVGLVRAVLPRSSRQAALQAADSNLVLPPQGSLLARAAHFAREYFSQHVVACELPLDLRGMTPFRQDVLRACAAIPYGGTRSYGELAAAVGKPRAARAVGQAMARNPLPLFVPCHRVIGADGGLTGFGAGLEWKRKLLALEAAAVAGGGKRQVIR